LERICYSNWWQLEICRLFAETICLLFCVAIYWGCIDDVFWPGVPWRTLNGCLTDWDRAWELEGTRRPMVWCFCDRDDCNVSIQKVNSTKWDELDAQTTLGLVRTTTLLSSMSSPQHTVSTCSCNLANHKITIRLTILHLFSNTCLIWYTYGRTVGLLPYLQLLKS
jgi:hypothetical protein